MKNQIEIQLLLNNVIETLNFEDPEIRPRDINGQSGGLINLQKDLDTIIIPDLHARIYFLNGVLKYSINNKTVLELLSENKIQIVCVGDGFHSERRCKDRWYKANEEYEHNFSTHTYIDEEMGESLGLMSIVMELKIKFPNNFHFLKGNHENILNEEGNGNHPFGKFTSEGVIVKSWIEKFYGKDFLYKYSLFEKSLPIIAVGKNFVVSHAEPRFFYNKKSLINYYKNSDLIFDLTWTRDNQGKDKVISKMIKELILPEYADNAYYFAGHCSISGKYNLKSNSNFVQLHNPDKCLITLIKNDKEIDLENDIGEING